MAYIQPDIILDQPQMGENIGMVARAMLNFGMERLHLINPRDGWPNEKAVQASAGAADSIFPHTKIYNNVKEALSNYQYVFATTARKRQQNITVISLDDMATFIKKHPHNQHAIIFGCERSGLDNDALSYADYIVEIPTNPDFSSLNLSQAVLLSAYSLHNTQNLPKIDDTSPQNAPAPFSETDIFLHRLIETIAEKGFFKEPDMQPIVTRNIRNSMKRAKWSSQELRTLHGILTSLTKY